MHWRIFFLAMMFIASAGCSQESFDRETVRLVTQAHQQTADRFARERTFIKDPVTGLCYVYWRDRFNSASMLVAIEESDVPPGQLFTGQIQK